MAYEGQVVKLENGRWARFQHLDVQGATAASWEGAILVAVELDEPFQAMLDDAASSLDEYYQRGITMQLTLAPNSMGQMSVQFQDEATVH